MGLCQLVLVETYSHSHMRVVFYLEQIVNPLEKIRHISKAITMSFQILNLTIKALNWTIGIRIN